MDELIRSYSDKLEIFKVCRNKDKFSTFLLSSCFSLYLVRSLTLCLLHVNLNDFTGFFIFFDFGVNVQCQTIYKSVRIERSKDKGEQ